jgi:tetratricopeptide (TPR) repeat protein
MRRCAETGWKYIEAPRPELYRLADDPGETRNLVGQKASVVAAMRQRLLAHDRGGATPTLPAVDPEAAERLAALGYVESGGSAGGAQSSVDPKDKIGELQAYQRDVRQGMALYRAKDMDGAIRVLSRAARSATSSFNVNYYLGRSLVERRRFAEAVPYLEKAVGMAPARQSFSGLAVAPVYAYLAEALSGAGRSREVALARRGPAAARSADLLRVRARPAAAGATSPARGPLEERGRSTHETLAPRGAYQASPQPRRARPGPRREADEAVRLDPKSPTPTWPAASSWVPSAGRRRRRAFREPAPRPRPPGRPLLPRRRRAARRPGRLGGFAPGEARGGGAGVPAGAPDARAGARPAGRAEPALIRPPGPSARRHAAAS